MKKIHRNTSYKKDAKVRRYIKQPRTEIATPAVRKQKPSFINRSLLQRNDFLWEKRNEVSIAPSTVQ